MAYFCKYCNENVVPEERKKNYVFFRVTELVCPVCGRNDLVNVEVTTVITPEIMPTNDHVQKFTGLVRQKKYYQALGLAESATREEIVDAKDNFEMEHMERVDEWILEMGELQKAIITPPVEVKRKADKTLEIKPSDQQKINIGMELLEEALDYQPKGDIQKAYDLCDRGVNTAPLLLAAYQLRAWMALQLPDYRNYLGQIVDDCKFVLEYQPYNEASWLDLGRAYSRLGELDNAIICYRKALILDPTSTITVLNLMEIEIMQKRYLDAIGTYASWRIDLEKNPDRPYRLISAYLLCVALALYNRQHKAFLGPLLDDSIKITTTLTWNNDKLNAFIDHLSPKEPGVPIAKEVTVLFMRHYKIK